MCLGTPVCTVCKVLYEYNDGGISWKCPSCNALLKDCDTHFLELSPEDKELYEDNSSKVRARKKKECLSKR